MINVVHSVLAGLVLATIQDTGSSLACFAKACTE